MEVAALVTDSELTILGEGVDVVGPNACADSVPANQREEGVHFLIRHPFNASFGRRGRTVER